MMVERYLYFSKVQSTIFINHWTEYLTSHLTNVIAKLQQYDLESEPEAMIIEMLQRTREPGVTESRYSRDWYKSGGLTDRVPIAEKTPISVGTVSIPTSNVGPNRRGIVRRNVAEQKL